jgi:hypothetical protein
MKIWLPFGIKRFSILWNILFTLEHAVHSCSHPVRSDIVDVTTAHERREENLGNMNGC